MCQRTSNALTPIARLLPVLLVAISQLLGFAQAKAQCDAWMSPLLSDTEIGANGPILAAVSYNSPQGNGTP